MMAVSVSSLEVGNKITVDDKITVGDEMTDGNKIIVGHCNNSSPSWVRL